MNISDLMEAMAEAGAPIAAITIAVRAIEAAHANEADRRAKNRERKQKERALSRDSHATVTRQVFKTKGSPTPLLKTQLSHTPSPPKGGSVPTPKGFDQFWEAYPRKTGKGAARKAYFRALAKIAGPDPLGVLLSAIAAVASKWDDPQFTPHPATWLNQERWDDETEPPQPPKPAYDPDFVARQKARIAAYAESRTTADHGPAEPPRRDGPPGLRSLRGELSLRSLGGVRQVEAPDLDGKGAAGSLGQRLARA